MSTAVRESQTCKQIRREHELLHEITSLSELHDATKQAAPGANFQHTTFAQIHFFLPFCRLAIVYAPVVEVRGEQVACLPNDTTRALNLRVLPYVNLLPIGDSE